MKAVPLFLLCFAASAAVGAIRGPGIYNGVILFDRWDTCYLYSAIDLEYIPQKLKESLRSQAGHSVALDATVVIQPLNPGDARLEQFNFLGLSQPEGDWDTLDQVELAATLNLQDQKHPLVKCLVRNRGPTAILLNADRLAFTVFTKMPVDPDGRRRRGIPSDGPSYALLTRESLFAAGDTHWKGEAYGQRDAGSNAVLRVAWSVANQDQAVKSFALPSGETKEFTVDLQLTEGEYDLVFGYEGNRGSAGEKAVASNLLAVDASSGGNVTVPKIIGR